MVVLLCLLLGSSPLLLSFSSLQNSVPALLFHCPIIGIALTCANPHLHIENNLHYPTILPGKMYLLVQQWHGYYGGNQLFYLRYIHVWYYKLSQKPVTLKVRDDSRNATIIFLNKHGLYTKLDTIYVYTRRLVVPSTFARSSFFAECDSYSKDLWVLKVLRSRDYWMLGPSKILYNPLQGTGNIGEEGTEGIKDLEDGEKCCIALLSWLGMCYAHELIMSVFIFTRLAQGWVHQLSIMDGEKMLFLPLSELAIPASSC